MVILTVGEDAIRIASTIVDNGGSRVNPFVDITSRGTTNEGGVVVCSNTNKP